MRRVGLVAVAVVLAVVFVAGIAVLTLPLWAQAALPVAGRLLGYRIAAQSVHASLSAATLSGLSVHSSHDEPILDARKVDVRYNLRDLLPGGHRLYGLTALSLDSPHVTVLRRPDGTYNIPLTSGGGPSKPGPPLDADITVRDGSVDFVDQRPRAGQRNFSLAALNVDAHVHPNVRSGYRVRADLLANGRYPIVGHGRFDGKGEASLQRWTAERFPLAPAVNYALDAPAFRVLSGMLNGVQVVFAGQRARDGSMQQYLFGAAQLTGGSLKIAGMAQPITNASGKIVATRDAIATPLIVAHLTGVPLHIAGGVFDLNAPKLRLGIRAEGAISTALAAVSAAHRLKIDGSIALRARIEGGVARPLALATLDTRDLRVSAVPLDKARASVALMGEDATILDAAARYGSIRLSAHGTITLTTKPKILIVAGVGAPLATVPFVDRLAPSMPLEATAILSGDVAVPAAEGVVDGKTARESLAGTFQLNADHTGRIGPLALDESNGAYLYGRVNIAQRGEPAHVVAVARNLQLHPAIAAVAGFQLPAIPALTGTVDLGAVGQFGKRGADFGAGEVSARNVAVAGVRIDEARASVLATRAGIGLQDVHARGPWGQIDGSGAVDGALIGWSGQVRADLAALPGISGLSGLRGTVDAPLRVVVNGKDAIAQVSGARLSGVAVSGLRVNALAATVAISNGQVNVPALQAQVEGSSVTAAGTLQDGMHVSLADFPATNARRFGVPLQAGTVTAFAVVRGTSSAPAVRGVAALSGGRLLGEAVAASTRFDLAHANLDVRDANAVVAGAVAGADGTVRGVGTKSLRYDLSAQVVGADLSEARRFVHTRYPLEGQADANLRVSGAGAAPSVTGNAGIPIGAVNGLYFSNLNAKLEARPGTVEVSSAQVTVGSSHLHGSGAFGGSALSAYVRAPGVDLADFNDFFDPGDMLGGQGFAAAGFSGSSAALATHGAVVLANARYGRYRLGAVRGDWSTTGWSVQARADVAAQGGHAALRGSALLPVSDPLRDIPHRIPLNATLVAERVDLSTWLPAANVFVPILGHVDADATIHGTLAAASAHAHAAANDAVVRGIAVQSATADATMQRGRVTNSSVVARIPQLEFTAGGSFGLRPTDAINVHVSATSPDVGALAKALGAKPVDASGTLAAAAQFTGSLHRPDVVAAVEVAQARVAGLTAPHVRLSANYRNSTLSLDRGEIDFTKGALLATAHVRVEAKTHRVLPSAPATGSLQIAGVELNTFVPLFPSGTNLAGTLNGHFTLSGTVHAPQTAGTLALTGGTYSSTLLKSPLSDLAAEVLLSGNTVKLVGFRATLGGGTISASAVTTLGDLRNPGATLGFDGQAKVSNASVDVPQYVRGTFDAALTAQRLPGGPIALGGSVATQYARIPLAALVPAGSANSTPRAIPNVAFALTAEAGRDVRVQSGQVDVGATGHVRVGGTLASPTLDGAIRATGGSIDFYRSFTLQRGTARFNATDGVVPTLDAIASTTIADPYTSVTLTVTGPATNLNVALASDPSYSRSQILGLLVGVQYLGAVNGVAPSASSPGVTQFAASIAGSTLSQQLTRTILEPLNAQIGKAFGLSQFAINFNPLGGFSANARKGLARNLDGVYGQTFSYPVRSSLGVEWHPRPTTSLQAAYFTQQGTGAISPFYYSTAASPNLLSTANNTALLSAQPAAGISGVTFVFQRRFWGVSHRHRPAPAASASPAAEPLPSASPEPATLR